MILNFLLSEFENQFMFPIQSNGIDLMKSAEENFPPVQKEGRTGGDWVDN